MSTPPRPPTHRPRRRQASWRAEDCVGASDCLSGLDNAWASAIDNHIADVITNSWTDGIDDINLPGSSYVAFYQQFSLEAALTGITVNFSSGDSGDQPAS